jgi:hypothetical protein
LTTGNLRSADREYSHARTGAWPPQLGRAARPVTVHLVVLAAYLAAGIAVNWTRATYLVDHVVPTGRDSGLFVWDYWWMARLLLHPSNPCSPTTWPRPG